MIAELLYFDGCPNVVPARELVESVLAANNVEADIRLIEITTATAAEEQKFLGSPTIRIDGVDVDPSAHGLKNYGMICRVYRQGSVASGVPPRHMIEDAIIGHHKSDA